jgi:hypothetical protein
VYLKEYDRVLLKDGREGTIVAGTPDGPYSVDVGDTPETWGNIFVTQDEIQKVI